MDRPLGCVRIVEPPNELFPVGALLGVVVAAVGVRLFNNAIVDIQRPFWIDVRLDPTVLVFTLVITLVASLIAGTAPAIQASGANANDVLKDQSRGATGFRMGKFSTAEPRERIQ